MANEGIATGFLGIAIENNYVSVAGSNGLFVVAYYEEQVASLENIDEHVIHILETRLDLHLAKSRPPLKIQAAGISSRERVGSLCAKLWLRLDIVPFLINWKLPAPEQAYANSLKVDRYFNSQSRSELGSKIEQAAYLYCLPSLGFQFEVKVDFERAVLYQLKDVQQTLSPTAWTQLLDLARSARHQRLQIAFISSTPQGGGVALMRHALIRLLRMLDVRVHWHVLAPSAKVFEITKKKFHNVLQGVSPPDVVLQEVDKRRYLRWIDKNAKFLIESFRQSSVVICDDPQSAGLLPQIRAYNPDAKLIYRSHIQIRSDLVHQPNSPQAVTWNFLWQFVKLADVFVSHPVREFVPDNVPMERVVMMPACTEPLDGLNKPLREKDMDIYLKMFNAFITRHNNTPLKPPYVAQIARFDPSKGIPDLMEAYRLMCEKLDRAGLPRRQLVLAGHGAVDDPEAEMMIRLVTAMRASEPFKAIADDIKLAVLPNNDQILNAIMSGSEVVFQVSRREGFEVKVTEAQLKGKPVIASRAGGIPLQVVDRVSGILVEPGDVHAIADAAFDLLCNDEKRQAMGAEAKRLASPEFCTPANARNWLFLALALSNNTMPNGDMQLVSDMVRNNNNLLNRYLAPAAAYISFA